MRNGLKKVMALVLTLMMILSLVPATVFAETTTDSNTVVVNGAATQDGEVKPTYTITIYYRLNGEDVAQPWTATVPEGDLVNVVINSPTVTGYKPVFADSGEAAASVVINERITANKTIIVQYLPDTVEFKVKHFQQNVTDDNYTEFETETKQGTTGELVGENLAKDNEKEYEGFYSLKYVNDTIAADGSTVVEIYYDRNYYLLSLDLDGGYGAEPVYARFGASISVANPTKPGYTFTGWEPALPSTMPAENQTLKAQWTPNDAVNYTVVFWYENANDAKYSYAGSVTQSAPAGTSVSSSDEKNTPFKGQDNKHFTYNGAKVETVIVNGDGSTVLNVYFTRNTYTLKFRVQGKDLKTITAKYQKDIHDNFPIKSGNDTIWWRVPAGTTTYVQGNQLGSIDIMPGESIVFTASSIESGAKIYYYVETLNGAEGDTSYKGKNYKQYKVIDLEYSTGTNLTYAEEFHPITGFTQGDSNPKLPVGGKVRMQWNNYLYYTRNNYNLQFYNYNAFVSGKGGSVQYEAPLREYNFTPLYPDGLEANAYEFAGWYTTPGCYEGSEVNWDTAKMPASDVTLYAKWAPKTHTVKTFLTKAEVTSGSPLNTWENVPHRSTIDKPANPTNGEYVFVGWFYEENGVEKAFDFSMAVTKDLELYAKWSSNVLVDYVVHYVIEGTTTQIADDTVGSARATTQKTFYPKGGDDLYADYREGYFPTKQSTSHTMSVDGSNEITIEYKAADKVPYTVKYIDAATGNALLPDKVVSDNRKAIVTEQFEVIRGYVPDAFQKTLVVTIDGENVIIFLYTKDEEHAYVMINHWIENLDGTFSEPAYTSSQFVGNIGTEYTGNELDIEGFQYVENPANQLANHPALKSGTLTDAGLELNLYYVRKSVEYTVHYYEEGTTTSVAPDKTAAAKYGTSVEESALDIPGYECVSDTPQTITIKVDATQNVITFYYAPVVTINYVAVTPDGGNGGSVTPTEETIRAKTGTAEGSTPNANTNYKFVGWFTDEACTTPVDPAWVDANGMITPQKETLVEGQPAMGYKAATYYAKFVLNAVKVKVTKLVTGNFGDKSKRFDIYEGKDRILMLLHNVPAELQNVLVNTKITWREDCVGYTTTAVCMVNNEKFADATVTYNAEGNPVIEFDFTNNPLPGDAEITITNHKEAHPDTGVLLDSLPYILIIACVAAIGAFIVIRRRKNRED